MFPVFAKTVLKSFVDKAFPVSKTGRPRSATTEELIDHIFILLRTGTQWRLLPTGLQGIKSLGKQYIGIFKNGARKGFFKERMTICSSCIAPNSQKHVNSL
jgi:transposase